MRRNLLLELSRILADDAVIRRHLTPDGVQEHVPLCGACLVRRCLLHLLVLGLVRLRDGTELGDLGLKGGEAGKDGHGGHLCCSGLVRVYYVQGYFGWT